MRRFAAMTAMIALVFSLGLPFWTTACTAMDKENTPMCHRTTAHHHCEMEANGVVGTGSKLVLQSHSSDCPMQCCVQMQSGNGPAVLAIPSQPELMVAEHHVDTPPITFVSSGFSSHTDRGPPSI